MEIPFLGYGAKSIVPFRLVHLIVQEITHLELSGRNLGESHHSIESESVSQSCLTLCHPIDCSPPGSTRGILQARILK